MGSTKEVIDRKIKNNASTDSLAEAAELFTSRDWSS